MANVIAASFRQALASNSVETAFAAKIPTITKPASAGVVDLLGEGLKDGVYENILVIPYGTDADDETFDMRIYGWNKDPTSGTNLWIPFILIDVSVTLSSAVFTVKAASSFMPDTITENAGAEGASVITSTGEANVSSAHMVVPTRGAELMEFDFDSTGAAAMNALWKPL